MMSKCEEYTKHRAAVYMKYVRTCASTASPQLPSGVELGKRSIEHSRHRKPDNFLANILSALIAYTLKPRKPSINQRSLMNNTMALVSS
ncbi:IS982 family transposase domain protein [Rickettsiales endosymbiont of Paramecium tredecaurelia]|uniref:hypothetical protein n=1 Tax=Candidatus Sarmatiella mevalonica TaxID=2770581 RepID=UPI001922FA36|nr:IS982 family transposase domain protein [Candidatus Sarmatiella mevalonica]